MKRFITTTILFLLFFPPISIYYFQTQKPYTITGIIYDKITGSPLQSVNVFLNGTTFGASTDKDGKYIIDNIPRGSYKIIASIIGYERIEQDIQLMDSSTVVMNFKLTAQAYKLEEIDVVTERDYEWLDDYELFKKYFLGTSTNSSECSIDNKGVLEFVKSEDFRLVAKASKPLIIHNYALGYKLYLDLKEFELLYDNEVNYYGSIRFEELEPKNQEQKLEWEEKREKAYKGTLRHFLNSLCANKLQKNGFYCYKVNFPKWNDLRKRNYLDPNLIQYIERVTPVERIIQYNGYIMIKYVNEWEEKNFVEHRIYLGSRIYQTLDYQTSWFKLPHGFAMFDVNGNIIDDYKSIKVYGYWAWEKIADLMPTDYVPKNKK